MMRLLKKMYVTMLRIRKFEEKVGELIIQDEIKTPCHLYIGQEAIATGVCLALKKDDSVFSTHRSHGHYIAKGGSIKTLMAELYGKKTGCSRGRGGSMHLIAPEVGFMGSSAIVAGTIPLAVGAALASTMQRNKYVSVAFFGDGAVDEGLFYESLNFASLKKFPVLFICENNLYSTHMHISRRQSDTDIYRKAKNFNMPGIRINGNDVIEVFEAAKDAIEDARSGRGPTLIECLTYRWCGHVGSSLDLDIKGLRDRKELEHWMNRCPIRMLERLLIERGFLSKIEIRKISRGIEEEIEEALRFAKESPYPTKSELS